MVLMNKDVLIDECKQIKTITNIYIFIIFVKKVFYQVKCAYVYIAHLNFTMSFGGARIY
jgi:hypothetical protein